jgi:hypothetical protein
MQKESWQSWLKRAPTKPRLSDKKDAVEAKKLQDWLNARLWESSKRGEKEAAELLIKDGVDINSADSSGRTALMFAAWHGHTDICRLLMENGAEMKIYDEDEWDAVEFARLGRHEGTVTLLVVIPMLGAESGTAFSDAFRECVGG